MSAPYQTQNLYPGANQYLGSGLPSRNSNVPTQVSTGPGGYQNAPYVPQVSPGGYRPQPQNQTFQPNANIQQQSPTPQLNAYQQYMPPPQQNPPPQTMSPPIQQAPHSQQMPPSQQMAPPQQAVWRRFMVPTNSDSISSGFPFHPQLYNLQMSHDEWHQFTAEIVEGAKLTASEDAAAWSTGASVGAVSSAFLLVFGPPIGYYAGKAVHKKTLIKKVKERMLENGDLRAVLNKWNQRNFKWRGFQVWLELPTDYVETTPGAPRHQAKAEKKEAQKFRLVVIPNSEIQEPYSAAPWSQMQPGLVEAPSVEPQRPVELQNTPAQNFPVYNEVMKGDYSSAVTQVPAASELDAQGTLHGSQQIPAELSG